MKSSVGRISGLDEKKIRQKDTAREEGGRRTIVHHPKKQARIKKNIEKFHKGIMGPDRKEKINSTIS